MTRADKAGQGRRPKFRAGQVVKHRIGGGFYMKIVKQMTDGDWIVIERGHTAVYRDEQLRKLNKREASR
jgi:hypothetical protein